MGARTTLLPVAIDWPADVAALDSADPRDSARATLVDWLRGGRACKKRTLDRIYLAQAEKAGVVVQPLHEVTAIIPVSDGYRVACRKYGDGYVDEVTVSAPRVILAAGTLNTIRLLLSCRDRLRSLPRLSDELGRRFFTNGDFGGLLINPQIDLLPDAGPPVTSWIDFWKESRLFLMETGTWLTSNWYGTPTNRLWSFGVMGFGESPSRIRLDRGGKLHRLNVSGGDHFENIARQRLRELADAAGARLLMPPRWLLGRRSVTVHPLGGAAMADSPERGVTDPFGEVFGYPGLYIADGSLLPTATGGPPSMTIAALAEHIIEAIVKKW